MRIINADEQFKQTQTLRRFPLFAEKKLCLHCPFHMSLMLCVFVLYNVATREANETEKISMAPSDATTSAYGQYRVEGYTVVF